MMESQQIQQKPFEFIVLSISAYLMLWLAIYNGYPIFYDDTGEYLLNSLTFSQSPYRSIIYSLFIRLVSWGMSPWLIVLAQSVIAIYVLRCAFTFITGEIKSAKGAPFFFLGFVVFLAFGTTLPWFVGQVMPDVFTGLCFLSAFLLLYDSKLSIERGVVLAVVLSIAIGSHLSNFISLGLVLLIVLILRAFNGACPFWPKRSTRAIAAFVLIPILVSIGVVTMSNRHAGFGFRLSAGTPVFLFARLIESGLADDYLEQECKIEPLTPCKYLHNLPVPSFRFLWGRHPLLQEMGGWVGAREEASRIAFGTIRRYPLRFLAECVRQMLRQVVLFRPSDENYPIQGDTVDHFYRLYPGEIPRYELTRQWSGKLSRKAARLYPLYEAVFWVCLCVCLVFLIGTHSPFEYAHQLFILTVCFIFSNALVTAGISGVVNRYQSRISWLPAICCASYVVPYWLKRRNEHRQV